jgi:hypothetical protein
MGYFLASPQLLASARLSKILMGTLILQAAGAS